MAFTVKHLEESVNSWLAWLRIVLTVFRSKSASIWDIFPVLLLVDQVYRSDFLRQEAD